MRIHPIIRSIRSLQDRLLASVSADSVTAGIVAAASLLAVQARASGTVALHWVELPGTSADRPQLSGDGKVVVGDQSGDLFRWSVAAGFQAVAVPDGIGLLPRVNRVNHDGSAFVGRNSSEGFLWSEGSGVTSPIIVPGGSLTPAPHGISSDGTVCVGDAETIATNGYAFRGVNGSFTKYGDLGGGMVYKKFFDVSGDGRYAVGSGTIPPEFGKRLMFLHDFATGQRIALSTSDGSWSAEAISTDGTVVTGSAPGTTSNAFRWEPASGAFSYIGSLDPNLPATPRDINGDGSMIVGISSVTGGSLAFVWNAAGGIRSLESYLQEKGFDTAGLSFTDALGISDDGDAILATATDTAHDNVSVLITGLMSPTIPTFQIQIGADGTQIEIHFDTVLGQNYRVEGTSELGGTGWNPESGTIQGTGTPYDLMLPRANYPQPKYFFRVATQFAP